MRIRVLLLVLALLIPLVSCRAVGNSGEFFGATKLIFIRTNELGDDVFFVPESVRVDKDRLTVTFIGKKKNKSSGIQSYIWNTELKPGARIYKTLSVTNLDAAGRAISKQGPTEWHYAAAGDPYDALIQTMTKYCRERHLPLDTRPPVYETLGFQYVGSAARTLCFFDPASIKIDKQCLTFRMLEALAEPQNGPLYKIYNLSIDRLHNKAKLSAIEGYSVEGRRVQTWPDIDWSDLEPATPASNALHYALGHARLHKTGLFRVDPSAADNKQYYWYDPYSIKVYSDYISVVMLTEDSSVVPDGAGYVLFTLYYQPQESRAKLAVCEIHGKAGDLLSYSGASFWRNLKPGTPGAVLLPKVLAHIRENRLPVLPTPPFAPPDLEFAFDASPRNAIFFNPSTIQSSDGMIAVETVFDLITPKEDGAKYAVMTVTFRIADKQYKTSEAIRYTESGEQVGVAPGQNWTAVLPGASYDNFLEHLLNYCQKNNIPL